MQSIEAGTPTPGGGRGHAKGSNLNCALSSASERRAYHAGNEKHKEFGGEKEKALVRPKVSTRARLTRCVAGSYLASLHSNVRSPSPLIGASALHIHTQTHTSPHLSHISSAVCCLPVLGFSLVTRCPLRASASSGRDSSACFAITERARDLRAYTSPLLHPCVRVGSIFLPRVHCSRHRPSSAVPPLAPPTALLPLSFAFCSSFLSHLPSPVLPLTLFFHPP